MILSLVEKEMTELLVEMVLIRFTVATVMTTYMQD